MPGRTQIILLRKIVKRLCLGLLILIGVALIWYGVGRAGSRDRVVVIYERPIPNRVSERPSGTMSVVAYNIAHARGATGENWGRSKAEVIHHLQGIADTLRTTDADVVVLNEVDFDCTWSHRINQARHLADALGYRYLVEQRNIDLSLPGLRYAMGNAVLSRHPVAEAAVVNWPKRSDREALLAGWKRGVVCTVEPTGRPAVRILAVHLESRSEAIRVASAAMINTLAKAGQTPLIAAGDFNSTPIGTPGARTDSAGRNAMTDLLTSGALHHDADISFTPEWFTFPATAPARKIDWVLATSNLRIVSSRVIESQWSDHLPITCQFAWRGD